jgi:hypothetical protein
MAIVRPVAAQSGEEDDLGPTGRPPTAFMSTRTLVIGGVAVVIATLAGISAGIATSAQVVAAYGLGIGVTAGLFAGAATWTLVFLSALSTLHRLVG